MLSKLLIICCVLFASEYARAQVQNTFLFDDTWSGVTGASNLTSIDEILINYEQAHLPQKLSDDSTWIAKKIGGLYRIGKSISKTS